jgi:hypothetical protein
LRPHLRPQQADSRRDRLPAPFDERQDTVKKVLHNGLFRIKLGEDSVAPPTATGARRDNRQSVAAEFPNETLLVTWLCPVAVVQVQHYKSGRVGIGRFVDVARVTIHVELAPRTG